jgi:hypothetical protein
VEEKEYEGFGRPFRGKRMMNVRIPHRRMDYRDNRNDIYQMRGRGVFSDIAKKFSEIFS